MTELKFSKKGIEYFFNSDWFEDYPSSTVFLRVYVSVGVSLEEVSKVYCSAIGNINFGMPIKITWAHLDHFNTLKLDLYYRVDEQGCLEILTESVDLDLPSANYAVFASPLKVDGGTEQDRNKIKAEFDKTAALIRAYAGKNLLYCIVSEGGYNAKSGVPTTSDMTIERIPSVLDGPNKQPFIWQQIQEVINSLGGSDEKIMNRLLLALEILNRAISNPKLSLFYYWTAIELVCDIYTGPKLRSKIASCYNFSNQHDVDKKLGFTVLYKWRGELVHKGMHKEIPIDIERYLQALLLDLIRYELGLKNLRFAEKCLSSKGFDFSTIGLNDNRTAEQKKQNQAELLENISMGIKPAQIQKRILGST